MTGPSAVTIAPGALEAGLERLGHTTFRPGQREAVETVLGDGRLLLVAPTGGGKSLTYQLPALLLEGTTLVVSPLISLMHDQVEALSALDIPATYLASTLEPEEMRARISNLQSGRYRLAYVAPERLASPEFRSLLAGLDCPLVAIDEAHCISEWGHDFRPDYMQIGETLKDLRNARVLACTATATPIVRDEIVERLGLPADTQQLVRGFARPNLALRAADVSGKAARSRLVDDALSEALGLPGDGRGAAIVYSPTRRATEDEAARLERDGWKVGVYHAGIDADARESAHRGFSDGSLEVVVATNAFGMGIDRADVRAVIHLAPPGSVEAWYQEVGRAGRDGEPAIGLMLSSSNDMPRRRHLIESDLSGPTDPEVVKHRWGLFLELMRLAEGGSCRHDAVLRYFGDEEETLAGCGRCDVCQRLAEGHSAEDEADPEEVAVLVRKALSGVARIHGRFGLTAAVALLRGVADERLARLGLNEVSTFGVLQDFSDDWLTRLLRRCVTAGWVDFLGGDRPVVALTEDGVAVMRGERPVRLLLPPRTALRPAGTGSRSGGGTSGRGRAGRGGASGVAPEDLDPAALHLFEALRAHRMEVARDKGVPPYVVASDRTLREIAQMRPMDLQSLESVHGIGQKKAALYGPGLIAVVLEHR